MSNPLKILWFIATADGEHPWSSRSTANGSYDFDHHRLRRLANGLDRLGYYGALTVGEAPWITISSLIPVTERLRFLIPIYPGVVSPYVLAKHAQTFDVYSNGRLAFNQVNGTEQILPQLGVDLSKAERYASSEEYWTLYKRFYAGDISPYEGKYFKFPGGREFGNSLIKAVQHPHAPVWGSGFSDPGIQHAGRVLDAYLTFLQRPDLLKAQIDRVREVAREHGRTVKVGVRCNVIVRETEEEAWAYADRLLERSGGANGLVTSINARLQGREGIAGGLKTLTHADPQIQARIDALNAGRIPSREELTIYPNIWTGVGASAQIDVVGDGRGSALVGSAKNVAARILELQHDIGIDYFILAGYPLLSEAERFADWVFPLLDLST